jgi:hypothetical protein
LESRSKRFFVLVEIASLRHLFAGERRRLDVTTSSKELLQGRHILANVSVVLGDGLNFGACVASKEAAAGKSQQEKCGQL